MSHRSKTKAGAPRTRPAYPATLPEYRELRRMRNNPLRITDDMRKVMDMLDAGWTLYQSTAMSNSHIWLDPPRGEASLKHETVRHATWWGLLQRRIIGVATDVFPRRKYTLTTLGRYAQRDGGVYPTPSRR